ncbi:glycosyltransferase 87 family protein [Williamsia sp. M5A3_1d]
MSSDSDKVVGREVTGRTLPRHPALYAIPVALTAVALYLQYAYIPFHARVFGLFRNQADLRVYRAGAQHLLHGQPIYDRPVLGHFDYTYTPFSTVVMQPLAWVSKDVAVVAWSILVVVALFYVVVASFRALGYRFDARLVVVATSLVGIALLLEPVRTTIWYGQINVFLMAVVMWDLRRPEGSRLRGVGVGLAAGVKLTPAFFVFFLAVTRSWRAVAVAAATGVATVLVGVVFIPKQSWMFWTDKVFDSQRVGDVRNPANQSLRGAIAHIFGTREPNTALWLLAVVVVAALGLGAAAAAHRRGNDVLALSLTGMTTTAVSPFSWGHHWVWFVPLLVVTVDLVLRAWTRGAYVRAVTLIALPVALVLSTFVWKFFVPEGALGLRPFYGIGLFMNPVPPWFEWFAAQPYLWVLLVTAIATLGAYLIGGRATSTRGAGDVTDEPVDSAVGGRPARR